MRMIRLSEQYVGELIDGRIGRRGPQLPGSALAIGSFDGLHRGHQELLRGVLSAQERLGLGAAGVFTFTQHPRQTLDPGSAPFLLTTWREKLAVLKELGCPVVIAADFCPQLSRLGYREFVGRFLVGYLGMKHLVAGHDVHLGAGREGNAQTLEALGQELGFSLEVFPAVEADGQVVSSSAIRRAVTAGDMKVAAAMLGRPYALWGEVTPGDRRGREIGYPTANLVPLDALKLLPQTGVYAVRVQVPGDCAPAGGPGQLARVTESLPEVDRNGELLSAAPGDWAVFGGMLNYGFVPTFHGGGLPQPRIEANIFGFDGNLRGRNVKVEWIERLRGEATFAGVDELTAQLAMDGAAARRVLGLA
ncbi:MAG: bifunctional riboflavin kinase/FMN adenylyltransferase [bacterium]|jgi:riboflavin kinase/FMN adenylyltransferase|nr:bifunctional riboflavin kinase/FMN adenylyltransferase [bacterium]